MKSFADFIFECYNSDCFLYEGRYKQESAFDRQAQEPAPQQQAPAREGPPPVKKTKGTLTIAFGRFNPPTTGHEKLLDAVASSSDDGDYIIVPSRSNDKKKNPLDADTKVSVMRQMFPQHSERIINDPQNRTIFDVLKKAHMDGYAGVRIIGGGDRVAEFEKLSNNYNGKLYQFDNLEVLSAGDRDPDGDDVSGMSASKQRKAATEGDFASFRKGVPSTFNNKQARELYNNIRAAMQISDSDGFDKNAPKEGEVTLSAFKRRVANAEREREAIQKEIETNDDGTPVLRQHQANRANSRGLTARMSQINRTIATIKQQSADAAAERQAQEPEPTPAPTQQPERKPQSKPQKPEPTQQSDPQETDPKPTTLEKPKKKKKEKPESQPSDLDQSNME